MEELATTTCIYLGTHRILGHLRVTVHNRMAAVAIFKMNTTTTLKWAMRAVSIFRQRRPDGLIGTLCH